MGVFLPFVSQKHSPQTDRNEQALPPSHTAGNPASPLGEALPHQAGRSEPLQIEPSFAQSRKRMMSRGGRVGSLSPPSSRHPVSTYNPVRHQRGNNLYPQSLSIWTDVFPTSHLRQLQEPAPAPCQEASESTSEARSLCRHLPGSPCLIRTLLGKQPKCIVSQVSP